MFIFYFNKLQLLQTFHIAHMHQLLPAPIQVSQLGPVLIAPRKLGNQHVQDVPVFIPQVAILHQWRVLWRHHVQHHSLALHEFLEVPLHLVIDNQILDTAEGEADGEDIGMSELNRKFVDVRVRKDFAGAEVDVEDVGLKGISYGADNCSSEGSISGVTTQAD